MNKTFVKKILYQLKRRFGSLVDLYHVVQVIHDPTTGKDIIIRDKYTIRKAVILPTLLKRQMAEEMGFHSSTGPGFDVATRTIIIDRVDLLKGIEIKNVDYFVIEHERYNIKSVEKLEDNQAMMFVTTHVVGSKTNEIFNSTMKQNMIFNQNVVLTP